MDWIELIAHTTTEGSDAVSEVFIDTGADGTMIEDRADIPDPSRPHGYWEIVDPELLQSAPQDVLVHAWFKPDASFPSLLDSIRLRLSELSLSSANYGALTLETRSVNDEAWKDVWKQYFKPFRAGKHLIVKPTWENYTPEPDDLIIEIDPGMAFGSGTHETTGMCLSLLEEIISGGEDVIDVGTGSGILAIGAALFGAKHVLAVDIDPDAVKVAAENVKLNRVSSHVTVRQGNMLDQSDAVCDICIVNIISDIIISFAKPLKEHIRPGGLFLCSGIVLSRSEEVSSAISLAGYAILRRVVRGEWTAFLARRTE